ncbi:MAG: NAD-binding protein [Desulfocapsaceae bacterium]|jgi:Trk K+ transport system NAD-binding subunit|nr:NAD-binding protein [Desulfocapsaceae bacterium]
MKTFPSQLIYFLQNKTTRRNFSMLWKFIVFLALIICLYSVLFHVLMTYEGRYFSWITGFYWTMTVMSTLGFGDITFHTDLGLLFTMVVLLSGVLFLLILLPFTFIQFFYAPWLEAQEKARTPRELPEDLKGHVIITSFDPITTRLIERLVKQGIPYVIVTADLRLANELIDQGFQIVVGEPDRPSTYRKLRIENAAMAVITNDDLTNTNLSFTIREVNRDVPIITNADHEHSIDILEFSGNIQVFQFMKMLGESLSRRTLGVGMTTNIIGRFNDILISEMSALDTELVGKSLTEANIRQETGVTVIGIMEEGKFIASSPHTLFTQKSILMLAGSAAQLASFDKRYMVQRDQKENEVQVVILGGGRVGHAAAETLAQHGVQYRIVEKRTIRTEGAEAGNFIVGDAADIATLKAAGIETAKSVIVTTHSDEMNIYLTFYCRQLRPDIQIISRSILERNVSKLHMAGADLVMSYASLGAGTIYQILQPDGISLFSEGLSVLSITAGVQFGGKTIMHSTIREKTGCSIIAIKRGDQMLISPVPEVEITESDELILIGTTENEKRILTL